MTPRKPSSYLFGTLALAALLAVEVRTGRGAETPWPADVSGWVKPTPGEHPRLLFRKADLPELKKRAGTPQGKAILKRLRFLLDGKNGDTLLPPDQPAQTPGRFTIGHTAGYGLLYQLT